MSLKYIWFYVVNAVVVCRAITYVTCSFFRTFEHMKILMICLGNICRSPMAEGILREKANQRDIQISIDSCGTNGYHNGEQADIRARENLQSKGIDISDLRSRQFELSDFDKFDQLFVMDSSNLNDILSLARNEDDSKKVSLFLNQAYPLENKNVPDPYYGGAGGFENVYNLLNEASEAFLNNIPHD